jgi:hypothetical protein
MAATEPIAIPQTVDLPFNSVVEGLIHQLVDGWQRPLPYTCAARPIVITIAHQAERKWRNC